MKDTPVPCKIITTSALLVEGMCVAVQEKRQVFFILPYILDQASTNIFNNFLLVSYTHN